MASSSPSSSFIPFPTIIVSPTSSPLATAAAKHAAEQERISEDARMDRMTVWMKNVEKVVADARQNFAAAATSMSSSSNKELPLPPLPVPLSRNHSRNSKLPRRVIAASQIFQQDPNGAVSPLFDTSMTSSYSGAMNTSYGNTSSVVGIRARSQSTAATSEAGCDVQAPVSPGVMATPTKSTALVSSTSGRPFVSRLPVPIPEVHTPSRQRRATVSTRSPEPGDKRASIIDTVQQNVGVGLEYQGSPSKRREKSRSHADLLQMPIVPVAQLHAELDRDRTPRAESQSPPPRLSEVLDRNLFISPPLISRDNLLDFDTDDEEGANPDSQAHHRARSPTSPSSYNNLRVDTSFANSLSSPSNANFPTGNRSRSYSYLSERTPEGHNMSKLSSGSNDLLASPYVVEAYPPRTKSKYKPVRNASTATSGGPNDSMGAANTTAATTMTNGSTLPIPDTPSRHRIEGVYDRFLMATSGVKRLGKGYQSEFTSLPSSSGNAQPNVLKKGMNPFSSGRKFVMLPPVSSADVIGAQEGRRAAVSVDELGMVGGSMDGVPEGVVLRERKSEEREREGGGLKGTLMKRAIKLMVPNNVSKRMSKVM